MNKKIISYLTISCMCIVSFGSCITTICPIDAAIIPFIQTDGPWSGYEGNDLDLWAKVNELNYPPYDWEWTFERVSGNVNDFTVTETTTSTTCTISPYFAEPCQYEVYIEVTNDHDTTVIWPSMYPCSKNDLIIREVQPLICDAGGPYYGEPAGEPNDEVQFYGSASGGLLPYTWDWDFGDGSVHSNEQNPTHVYFYENEYYATLTVTDSQQNTCNDGAQVFISDWNICELYVTINTDLFWKEGQTVVFNVLVAATYQSDCCDYEVEVVLDGETTIYEDDGSICGGNPANHHTAEWYNAQGGSHTAVAIVRWTDDQGYKIDQDDCWFYVFQFPGKSS